MPQASMPTAGAGVPSSPARSRTASESLSNKHGGRPRNKNRRAATTSPRVRATKQAHTNHRQQEHQHQHQHHQAWIPCARADGNVRLTPNTNPGAQWLQTISLLISPHWLDSLWSEKFRQQCASNWRKNSRKNQTRAWHPRGTWKRHWLQQGPRYRNFTITRWVSYARGPVRTARAALEAVRPPEIPWRVAWREAAPPPTFEPRHLWNLVLPPATPATLPLPCSPSLLPPPTFF